MHTKLLAARDSKAVVVTTPIAIKAFILKFVEMLHILDKLSTDPKSLPMTNTNRAGDVSLFYDKCKCFILFLARQERKNQIIN
jgi:hypothetical protein